jgi:hypothetical protein
MTMLFNHVDDKSGRTRYNRLTASVPTPSRPRPLRPAQGSTGARPPPPRVLTRDGVTILPNPYPPRNCTHVNSPAKKMYVTTLPPRKKAVRDQQPPPPNQSRWCHTIGVCIFFGPARFDSCWFLDLRGAYHSMATTEPFLHTPNHGGDCTWNNSTATTNHGASPALAKSTLLLNEIATYNFIPIRSVRWTKYMHNDWTK